MMCHRRAYFPWACTKKPLALRPARPEASACKSADRFCPSLQGSRNARWTECHFFRWRSSVPSGKKTGRAMSRRFRRAPFRKSVQADKNKGVPCRVAHSRHGIPLGSCLAKRPSLHFSRDVDARWAGAHVHTRQNAAFWLGWAYESVACPPVFIALAPEMEA